MENQGVNIYIIGTDRWTDSDQILTDHSKAVSVYHSQIFIHHRGSHVHLANNHFPNKKKLQRGMEPPVVFVLLLAMTALERGETELFSTFYSF